MIIIKKVGEESIFIISSLAKHIWPVAYKGVITTAEIEHMLELMYSEASLQTQVKEKKHQFLIAYDEAKAVGYASYSPLDNSSSNQIYRLHKLYLSADQQGKGLGRLLLDYIIAEIKPLGASVLELNVNRHNKAFHFYQKMGFEITKEELLDVGNGYLMEDYVMAKKL